MQLNMITFQRLTRLTPLTGVQSQINVILAHFHIALFSESALGAGEAQVCRSITLAVRCRPLTYVNLVYLCLLLCNCWWGPGTKGPLKGISGPTFLETALVPCHGTHVMEKTWELSRHPSHHAWDGIPHSEQPLIWTDMYASDACLRSSTQPAPAYFAPVLFSTVRAN